MYENIQSFNDRWKKNRKNSEIYYVGSILTSSNGYTNEIEVRIDKARITFIRMGTVRYKEKLVGTINLFQYLWET